MKNISIAWYLTPLAAAMITASSVGTLTAQREVQRVTIMPEVISNVGSLELIEARAENIDKSEARAIAKLKNNSSKSIIAVTIECGDEKDSSSVTQSGIRDGDVTPEEIVKPFETFEMSMPFSNLMPGLPLRISAVMYADGTAGGEKKAVERLFQQKEYHRGRPKDEKPSAAKVDRPN